MAESENHLQDLAASGTATLRFRLYVADAGPNSVQAIANFHKFCEGYLKEYELEIVDVLESPLRALEDGVLITPALVRLTPPVVRIVGNLSDAMKLRRSLGF